MKKNDIYFVVRFILNDYELKEGSIKTSVDIKIINWVKFKNDDIRQLIDNKVSELYHSIAKEFNKKLLLLTKDELDQIVQSNKYVDFISGYVTEDNKKQQVSLIEYNIPGLSDPKFDDLRAFENEIKVFLDTITDIYNKLKDEDELTPKIEKLILSN